MSDAALSLTHTLREAARHGERAVLLCSFQKEESVLLDELLRLNDEMTPASPSHAVRIVTIDTGVLFPETLATWKAFEERFGVKIEVQDASSPDREGGPWCRPRALLLSGEGGGAGKLPGGRGGLDHGHSPRAGTDAGGHELIERDEKRGLWKYNPLAHWTDKDLWRRIHDRDLPYNTLHDQGYESIGCAPCTQPGAGREGRWAGTDKTECGLHVEVVIACR